MHLTSPYMDSIRTKITSDNRRFLNIYNQHNINYLLRTVRSLHDNNNRYNEYYFDKFLTVYRLRDNSNFLRLYSTLLNWNNNPLFNKYQKNLHYFEETTKKLKGTVISEMAAEVRGYCLSNPRQTISTLTDSQRLRLDSVSQVLFKPSKCGVLHFCHFSIRVNVPDRAMDYVRKYIHKMAGNGKSIQVIFHESDSVQPHFHVIHCGKSSPPRTNAMRHFIKYHCSPFRTVIRGQHKFTSSIAAAYRHHLIQLYLVGSPGYHPVVFKIAPQGSITVVNTGYNLFPSTTLNEKPGEPEADQEEAVGCAAAHSKGGVYPLRKWSGAMEQGLDGANVNADDQPNETQPEPNADQERRATLQRALQQKKTAVLIAPTPLEMASLAVELYVTSIEILENFKPWQHKFIKLALKEQRHRENVFQSTEVIVDLQTKNWTFDEIGRHVFLHNTLFPNMPCWFASSGICPLKNTIIYVHPLCCI